MKKWKRGGIYVVEHMPGRPSPCLVIQDSIGYKVVVVHVDRKKEKGTIAVGNGWYSHWHPFLIDPKDIGVYLDGIPNHEVEEVCTIPVQRGDVVWVHFGDHAGIKRCVVVQNRIGNLYSPTTIVLPLVEGKVSTTLHDASIGQFALSRELHTVDKTRIVKKEGTLKDSSMVVVDEVVVSVLELEKPKEVFWVQLPSGIGSEQSGFRPCIILHLAEESAIAVPITKALHAKAKIPTHVEIDKGDFLSSKETIEQKSIILWEQPRKVEKRVIREKIGVLRALASNRIDVAAKISLGLEKKRKTTLIS